MVSHKHHKVFIGITSVIVLVLGLLLGAILAVNLEIVDLEIINIALAFTSVILLLIVGGLVLEVKDMLNSKTRGRR
jgi:hypothetical protein